MSRGAAAVTSGTAELNEVKAHLATCAQCTRDLMIIGAARHELQQFPVLAAPANLRDRVQAQLTPSLSAAYTPAQNGRANAGLNGLQSGFAAATVQPEPATSPVRPQRNHLPGALTAFFRRPTNVAWTSALALVSVCLVLRSELPQPTLDTSTNRAPSAVAPAVGASHVGASRVAAVSPSTAASATAPPATTAPATATHHTPGGPKTHNVQPRTPLPARSVAEPDTATSPGASINIHHSNGTASSDSGNSRHHPRSQAHFGKAAPTSNQVTTVIPKGDHPQGSVPPAPQPGATPANGQSTAKIVPRTVTHVTQPVQPTPTETARPFVTLTLLPAAGATGPGERHSKVRGGPPHDANPGINSGPGPGGPSNPTNSAPPDVGSGPRDQGANAHPGVTPAVAPRINPGLGALSAPTPQGTANLGTLDFGPVGEARQARLFLWPPSDLDNAEISVTLSAGLKFTRSPVAGGLRTVWQGATKQQEPVKIVLDLTALEPGPQTIQVTFAHAGKADTGPQPMYEVVRSQTLTVNVAAR